MSPAARRRSPPARRSIVLVDMPLKSAEELNAADSIAFEQVEDKVPF